MLQSELVDESRRQVRNGGWLRQPGEMEAWQSLGMFCSTPGRVEHGKSMCGWHDHGLWMRRAIEDEEEEGEEEEKRRTKGLHLQWLAGEDDCIQKDSGKGT